MNRYQQMSFAMLLLVGSVISFWYGTYMCVDCAVLYPCRGCSMQLGEYPYCFVFALVSFILLATSVYNGYITFKLVPECKVCGRELDKPYLKVRRYFICKTCWGRIRNRLNRESRKYMCELDVLYEKLKKTHKIGGAAR